MFMPSLNNYTTRLKMALDIPLCKTIKGQKSMSFPEPKIWNKLSSNIKTAATTTYFTHRLKKEILSKLEERAILLNFFFIIIFIIFVYLFLTVDCFFTIFLCVHTFRGTLIEVRSVLDLC